MSSELKKTNVYAGPNVGKKRSNERDRELGFMLSDQEILARFKEIFDLILPMEGTTLNGRREIDVIRNVLTFSIINLAKRLRQGIGGAANDNQTSIRNDPSGGPL